MLYKLRRAVLHYWYSAPSLLTWLLVPFSMLYGLIILLRKYYFLSIRKKTCFNIPVIVVGNITVGGTGKTPFVIWLAQFLKQKGYYPGIISRGYGGKSRRYPVMVTAQSDPHQTGDEAILLSLRTDCPVVIDPDRVRGVTFLINNTACNIIISDDGLQHYRLKRDIEIAMIDDERRIGNGFCLPAGPLREPLTRLEKVDFIILNGQEEEKAYTYIGNKQTYTMRLVPEKIYNLLSPDIEVELSHFLGEPVYAIAGIGNPEHFFNLLRNLGLSIWPHSFPDHHQFVEKELYFNGESKIIMTEKDAVKCRHFAEYRYWCLPVNAHVAPELGEAILAKIQAVLKISNIEAAFGLIKAKRSVTLEEMEKGIHKGASDGCR